jgi:hypothetical protein
MDAFPVNKNALAAVLKRRFFCLDRFFFAFDAYFLLRPFVPRGTNDELETTQSYQNGRPLSRQF